MGLTRTGIQLWLWCMCRRTNFQLHSAHRVNYGGIFITTTLLFALLVGRLLCSIAVVKGKKKQLRTGHGLKDWSPDKCLKGSLSIELVKLWVGVEDRWDIFP